VTVTCGLLDATARLAGGSASVDVSKVKIAVCP